MVYTILCVLQASFAINNDQQHIITKEFYSEQLISSDIYFIENIPKTSKNAAHVLQ